jgi:broad specificity phosphatase PhoE
LIIYLIRHASPDWNRKDLPYHLPPGPSLTEKGKEEAKWLGNYLKQVGARSLFVSPLERCKETASIVSQIFPMQVKEELRIIEWQPEEDENHVQIRMRAVFDEICYGSGIAGPIGLVTHGGPIRVLLASLGLPPEVLAAHRIYDHMNPSPPAGVWIANREIENVPWQLELVFAPEPFVLGA